MERQVEMAIQQALSLARARGGKLAAITLRGPPQGGSLLDIAAHVLRRLEVDLVEVHIETGHGTVELVSIELLPPSRR
jgi:hypothetical protein